METHNRLKEVRERAGASAAELARRVGVSRQTVYAIEAGTYVPNTTTALLLARELGSSVEELFALAGADAPPVPQPVEWLGGHPADGDLVRLCRVGGKTIATPAMGETFFLPAVDGVVAGTPGGPARVRALPGSEAERRVLLAGCDPGLSILAQVLRASHVDAVVAPASSGQSIEHLRRGLVHVAGTHLRDDSTGEYNLPLLRRLFPRTALHVATFAAWREGLLVRRGNPKAIRGVADLVRKDVVIINRQEGAGSRQLLDRSLEAAGIASKRVSGYSRIAAGHLPAAGAVARGEADCCIATESAARLLGLDFLPLAAERFDLVTLRKYLDLPPVQAVFDTLARATVRQRLQVIAGYDVSQTGSRQ